MKNNGKNRSVSDSHSASDAAALLGISVPTLKRMVRDGTLEGFHTPGGHLRVLAESIEAVGDQRQARRRPVRDASPVLQNRRERLEELTLEAQEHRARRELEKLRQEEREEAEEREDEAQDREEEAAQRQAELELEQERLEFEKAQERARLKQQQAEEWAKREAERELAEFHCRWMDKASEALSAYQYHWLSAPQRKEVLEGLEAEIQKRDPREEPRMTAILTRSLEALVEPLKTERDAQEGRERLIKQALWNLPYTATDEEKTRAAATIREALRRCDPRADKAELQAAAEAAIQPVRQGIEKRLFDARMLDWEDRQLPGTRTDFDRARVRRECAEILAELPEDVSEVEAKEALESTITEASQEIKQRQAERDRQARKATLIQQGVAEISSYLLELRRDGEITAEEYLDSELTAYLQACVRRELEQELTRDESAQEVKNRAREIIDEALEHTE